MRPIDHSVRTRAARYQASAAESAPGSDIALRTAEASVGPRPLDRSMGSSDAPSNTSGSLLIWKNATYAERSPCVENTIDLAMERGCGVERTVRVRSRSGAFAARCQATAPP